MNKERKPSSTSERLDSTGSSLASHMIDPRLAEDIIREHGEVPDFTGQSFPTGKNIYQMCCVHTTPS